MNNCLSSLFASFEQQGILYCLMRDGHRIDQLSNGGEIDILVSKDQIAAVRRLATRVGFVNLPNWGHAPHYFFVSYDLHTDSWFKLDVITDIAYGKPIRNLHTGLAKGCIEHRQHKGKVYTLSPEDELATLLLHCILDKGCFSTIHRQRIESLKDGISDEPYIDSLLRANWLPSMTWRRLERLIGEGAWDELLGEGKSIAGYLDKDKVGTFMRFASARVLRKMNALFGWINVRGISVTLLAPDGAGKSTLADLIQESFYFPVSKLYMGLYQKGKEAKHRFSIPGVGLSKRLIRIWIHYIKAVLLLARGQFVIFDRYTYDAFLSPRREQSILQKARRWLLSHSCPAPDLVIVLDAPGEILFARKGEHSVASLEDQRRGYLKLNSYLPQLDVVDASQDIDLVRREVTSLMWKRYLKKLNLKVALQ
jgi:thymidylate kinase